MSDIDMDDVNSPEAQMNVRLTPVGPMAPELNAMLMAKQCPIELVFLLRCPVGGGVVDQAGMAANFTSRQDVDNWLSQVVQDGFLTPNYVTHNRATATSLWVIANECAAMTDTRHAGTKAEKVADVAAKKKTTEKEISANEMQAMYATWEQNNHGCPLTANQVVSVRGFKKLIDMMEADGNVFVCHTLKDFKLQSKVQAITTTKKQSVKIQGADMYIEDDDEHLFKTKFFEGETDFWDTFAAYLRTMVVITMHKKVTVTRRFNRESEKDPFFDSKIENEYYWFIKTQASEKNLLVGDLFVGEEKIRTKIMEYIHNSGTTRCETFADTRPHWVGWANEYFIRRRKQNTAGGDRRGDKRGDNGANGDDGGKKTTKGRGKGKGKGKGKKKQARTGGGGKKTTNNTGRTRGLTESNTKKFDKDCQEALAARKKGQRNDFKGKPDKLIYGKGPWGKVKAGSNERVIEGGTKLKVHSLLHDDCCPFHHGHQQHCSHHETKTCKASPEAGHDDVCGARLADGSQCKSKDHTTQQHFRAHEDGYTSTR